MIAWIACLINRHRPERNRIRREHLTYVGVCRHCGKGIIRRRHKRWVRRRD